MLCVRAWGMMSHDMGQSVLLLSVSGSRDLDTSFYCRAPGALRIQQALGLSTLDLISPSGHSTNVSCLDWIEL